MIAARRYPPQRSRYVLILWGDSFDEAAAAIFATELRQAGLAVKVVGLAGHHAAGLHGLLLGADLTLADALRVADRVIGVILPCTLATVRRIDNDPRVYDLLQQVYAQPALLVIQQADVVDSSRLKGLTLPRENVIAYGETEDLIAFARTLAITMENQGANR